MSLQAVKSIFPPVSSAASGGKDKHLAVSIKLSLATGATAQLAIALQNTMMQSILNSAAAHMHVPIKDTSKQQFKKTVYLSAIANNNTSLLPGTSGRIVCQQCGETMVNDAQIACEKFLKTKSIKAMTTLQCHMQKRICRSAAPLVLRV